MGKKIILLLILLPLLSGCGIYSFSGTSIAPDVKSISIYTIENKAQKINPSLSNTLTLALQDKYRKLTKLEMFNDGGDLEVSGFIMSYDVSPTSITSAEVAAQNRLTITVKIMFTNNKHPEETGEKSFAAFQDYDSNLTLEQVEAQLVDDIVEILVEDIFNATVANW
ncbi:MAG: LPS assembly lipoprotein LptE [Bacteroidales bacterium]